MKRFKPWLVVVLTAVLAGVFLLAILYFSGNAPWTRNWGKATPFTQEGAISITGKSSGMVVYPIPFGESPQLEIKNLTVGGSVWMNDKEKAVDNCELIQQTQLGFAWAMKFRDSKEVFDSNTEIKFTWKATGSRPKLGQSQIEMLVQQGSFQSITGEQGMENFAYPYALPPNVELSGPSSSTTIVVECTAKGFKWKNAGKKEGDNGKVQWTAKGIKATSLPE